MLPPTLPQQCIVGTPHSQSNKALWNMTIGIEISGLDSQDVEHREWNEEQHKEKESLLPLPNTVPKPRLKKYTTTKQSSKVKGSLIH